MADIDMFWPWPLRKGRLGRCNGGCLSTPNDELLLDFSSKLVERFSLRVWANPESLRDTGVVGIGGKFIEMGETDDGGLPLPDFPVGGRSGLLGSSFAFAKALKSGAWRPSTAPTLPNVDEFCVTHFPREPGCV